MFTTGKYNHLVPKESRANLAWRLKLYRAAVADRKLQRGLIAMCAEDVLFYINAFGWQHNPKATGSKVGPFICWKEQEELLTVTVDKVLNKREDVGWEKSREVGATWLMLFLDDWIAKFIDYSKVLDISHTEAAVDSKDDPDSLFAKIEFINDHQPDWLRQGCKKRKLGFKYPKSKGSITGAATTERSGVGGRSTKVGLDEFSKHRTDYAIWGQTRDTGPRLMIGTHYGLGSCFFKLTRPWKPDGSGGMKNKFVLHWSVHPEKKRGLYKSGLGHLGYTILDKSYVFPPDFKFVTTGEPFGGACPGIRSPWYDEECLNRNKRDVAMHLDIDPEGSTSQYFDAFMINTLIEEYCQPPAWEGDVEYDPESGQPIKLVKQMNGPLQLWVLPDALGRMAPGKFVSGWDVAEGWGKTPSCGSIWDVESGTKIGRYTNARIDSRDLAPVIFALGMIFHDADGVPMKVGWEVPGPGYRMGRALMDLNYRNIYLRTRTDQRTRKTSEIAGWNNSPQSMSESMGEYRSALYQRRCLNRCREDLEELLKFEYDAYGKYPKHSGAEVSNEPGESGVNHGDHGISDMIGWWLAKPMVKEVKEKRKVETAVGSLAWRMKFHDNLRRKEQEVW